MKIVIEYNGKTYESPEDSSIDEEFMKNIYENMDKFSRFKMKLKDGGYLVIGENAVKSAVFLII